MSDCLREKDVEPVERFREMRESIVVCFCEDRGCGRRRRGE